MDTHLSLIIKFLVMEEPASFCHEILCGQLLYTPQLPTNSVHTLVCVHSVLDYVTLFYMQYLIVAYSCLVWIRSR